MGSGPKEPSPSCPQFPDALAHPSSIPTPLPPTSSPHSFPGSSLHLWNKSLLHPPGSRAPRESGIRTLSHFPGAGSSGQGGYKDEAATLSKSSHQHPRQTPPPLNPSPETPPGSHWTPHSCRCSPHGSTLPTPHLLVLTTEKWKHQIFHSRDLSKTDEKARPLLSPFFGKNCLNSV